MLRADEPAGVAVEIIFPVRSVVVRGDFTRCLRLSQETRPVMNGEEVRLILLGNLVQGDGMGGDILGWDEIWKMELLDVVGELSGEGSERRIRFVGRKYIVRRHGVGRINGLGFGDSEGK